MNFGIDKIGLFTKEFSVLSNNNLRIKQGDIMPGGVIIESQLYNNVKGIKAIYNSKYATATIKPQGLVVEYNPSKILHPYNLCNDNKQLMEVHSMVRKDLKDNGIILPPDKGIRTSRTDLTEQAIMDVPVSHYAPVFRSLKGNRQSPKEHPGSFYFYNKSQATLFYDKKKSLEYEYKQKGEKQVPIINPFTMRGEIRMMGGKTVGNVMRFNDVHSLITSDPEYRKGKFKSHLNKQLFMNQDDTIVQTTLFPDYQRNIEYLKMLKETSGNPVTKFIEAKGIEHILEEVGTLENLRLMLVETGIYTREASYKKIAKLRVELHRASMFFGDRKRESVSSLYNEVYEKFVA